MCVRHASYSASLWQDQTNNPQCTRQYTDNLLFISTLSFYNHTLVHILEWVALCRLPRGVSYGVWRRSTSLTPLLCAVQTGGNYAVLSLLDHQHRPTPQTTVTRKCTMMLGLPCCASCTCLLCFLAACLCRTPHLTVCGWVLYLVVKLAPFVPSLRPSECKCYNKT